MKFSPSTINQRLAAIRKLATEAQRCAYVDWRNSAGDCRNPSQSG
jgi:hypothetical protein